MRLPRRDVYIEYFHPGAGYDAAAPILPNIPLETGYFDGACSSGILPPPIAL